MTDLLALAAELVDIPSTSFHEGALADRIEAELRTVSWLEVDRVGDNVVARSDEGQPFRLVLAGHTDTVPPAGNQRARVEDDVLWGVGSADMKGTLAVMLDLARTVDRLAVDVSYVFYAREEVASRHSGLLELLEHTPELVHGDVALLGEPTGAALEAGCQGTMRLRLTLAGRRAHTARAWLGDNAIHRLGGVLARLDGYEARRPVIDGCEYHEGLQAVFVEGGVAGNVVPDQAEIVVNHRFAPDRTPEEAEEHVVDVLMPDLGPDDQVELVELAEAAPPSLDHPLLRTLVDRNGLEVRAKLGWTDVARFAAHGIPAANFGAGDPHLAHTADEHLERADLDRVHAALADLLVSGG